MVYHEATTELNMKNRNNLREMQHLLILSVLPEFLFRLLDLTKLFLHAGVGPKLFFGLVELG